MNFNEIFRAYKDVFLLLYEFHLKNKLHLIWGNHDMVLRKHKRTKKLLDSYFDEGIMIDVEGFKDIAVYLNKKTSQLIETPLLTRGFNAVLFN